MHKSQISLSKCAYLIVCVENVLGLQCEDDAAFSVKEITCKSRQAQSKCVKMTLLGETRG